MNIVLESDRAMAVVLLLHFKDNATWQTHVSTIADTPTRITVVGRWPEDIAQIILNYDGWSLNHPVIINPNGGALKKNKIIRIPGSLVSASSEQGNGAIK